MVVARVNTVAFQGIEVLGIDVQVQMSGGIVAFTVVGLPDKAVGESRERVRAALHALGLALPAWNAIFSFLIAGAAIVLLRNPDAQKS